MRTAEWTSTVSVLDRVSAVLDVFAEGDVGLGVTEIATRAQLPKSTVSRLAAELVRQRCLERVGDRFYLGMRFFELGAAVPEPRQLARLALPLIADLQSRTGRPVRLSTLDTDHVVTLLTLGGPLPEVAVEAGPLRAVQGGERGPLVASDGTLVTAAAHVPGEFAAVAVTAVMDLADVGEAREGARSCVVALRGVLERVARR